MPGGRMFTRRARILRIGNSSELLRELTCRSNMGITILPEITLGSILPDEIVCIPLTFPILERTVNLAYDSRKKMSQACRLFLEFCTEYFCAHPEGRQEGAPLQSGQRFAQGPAAF